MGICMKKGMEHVKSGCITGLILFLANLLVISLFGNEDIWKQAGSYAVLLLAGYLLAGILLAAFRNREKKIDKRTYYGAAGLYWYIPVMALIFLLIAAAPVLVQRLVLCDVAVLVIMWLIEYTYLYRMSKKLNNNISLVKDSLAIELPEKVTQINQIYDFLTEYCMKNDKDLVIENREIPGKVEIDKKTYSVTIQEYYGFFGMPSYDLLLTSLTLKNRPER